MWIQLSALKESPLPCFPLHCSLFQNKKPTLGANHCCVEEMLTILRPPPSGVVYWFVIISNPLVYGLSKILFLLYFIDYAITVFPIFPLYPPSTLHPPTLQHPTLSSCPWIVHISSLSSLFPILFLISPYLFYVCLLYTSDAADEPNVV